jgi:hypothetical protein
MFFFLNTSKFVYIQNLTCSKKNTITKNTITVIGSRNKCCHIEHVTKVDSYGHLIPARKFEDEHHELNI